MQAKAYFLWLMSPVEDMEKAKRQSEALVANDRAETAHACTKTRSFEPPSSLQQISKLGNTSYYLPEAMNS